MTTVINTNVPAIVAKSNMDRVQRELESSIAKLSSGSRINKAADDAAGMAVANRMESQIRGLSMAVRHAKDGQNLIDTADGASVEVSNILQRLRELAVQAASDTMTTNDRAALNTEFQQLDDQIDLISTSTEWNGTKLLDGSLGAVEFHVGAGASQVVSITFADLNTNAGSTEATEAGTSATLDVFNTVDGSSDGTDLDGLVITSTAQSTTLGYLDTVIARVDAHRATLGAVINRLEYAADNLANVSQNTSASRSRVLDADYAAETTELARTQIIQQAATAMLSQANQQAQSVLALLK